jgi:glycoprotein-N-acetylgalactosamine 3-beta-galactosyltransferase
MEKSHATFVRAMRETWAPYCDGFLVFSTASDARIPAISIPHDGPEDYNNMWQKIRSILKFVGTHYLDDFDFFYQGGDDLFVIPQNLKRYLQQLMDHNNKTQDDNFFVGRRFKSYLGAFNTGGAGYALSRGTLRTYINEGWNHTNCFPLERTSMEDVMISQCLLRVFGIGLTDTRDHELRERFHHFPPDLLFQLRPPGNGNTVRHYDWYFEFNREWPIMLEEMCCSPSSVSFHLIRNPATVRHLHALINTCDDSRGLTLVDKGPQ